MGYVELKPAPTKVGAPPASSPMPSSAVATETTAATPSKTETGDHEPSETVKPVTKVEVAPTVVTPKTDGKGSSALSARLRRLSLRLPILQQKLTIQHPCLPPAAAVSPNPPREPQQMLHLVEQTLLLKETTESLRSHQSLTLRYAPNQLSVFNSPSLSTGTNIIVVCNQDKRSSARRPVPAPSQGNSYK